VEHVRQMTSHRLVRKYASDPEGCLLSGKSEI